MAAMTSLHAEKYCHLVSAHAASALQHHPPVPDLQYVHSYLLVQICISFVMYRCRMQDEAAAEVHGNTEAPPGEQVGN